MDSFVPYISAKFATCFAVSSGLPFTASGSPISTHSLAVIFAALSTSSRQALGSPIVQLIRAMNQAGSEHDIHLAHVEEPSIFAHENVVMGMGEDESGGNGRAGGRDIRSAKRARVQRKSIEYGQGMSRPKRDHWKRTSFGYGKL